MKTRFLVIGLVGFLSQGCGDSTGTSGPDRLVVTPQGVSLEALGETQQYTAKVEDKKGNAMPEVPVSWTISDASLASITPSGLVTGIKKGTVIVRATAEGLTGNSTLSVDPVPRELTKVAGDGQVGILRQLLPTEPTVEVRDANGNPVEDFSVLFAVTAGGGSVSRASVKTGADGRAATVWQLGCSNENPQRLVAQVAGLDVSFTATADLSALAICQDAVPDGRETQAYNASIQAAGGDPGTTTWDVASGALPPGLVLQADGVIDGTPSQSGSFVFHARVQDGFGQSASAPFLLRVCEAPIVMAPGASMVLAPVGSDECGFFLPSGTNGDRYRIGVVYTASNVDSLDVRSVSVAVEKEADPSPGAGLPGPRLSPSSKPPTPFVPFEFTASFREALRVAEATEAYHNRIRRAEKELLRKLGPEARPLPDRRALTRAPWAAASEAQAQGPQTAAPNSVLFTNPEEFTSCTVGETRRATKIGENADLVIYQDSIQRITEAVSDSQAQWMLDYYASYGKQVIDSYFGGTTDINGDGQIVIFVTPVVEEGTAAFVWSGDFFPKTPQPLWGACAASNEMEMMRFSRGTIQNMASDNYQALATVVHEAKHISSLYNTIIRGDFFEDNFQPLFAEEGTAEIAGELSSRLAWAATGGPAVGTEVGASDVVNINKENYGIILRAARVAGYLSAQPNGVVVTPEGGGGDNIYGSGWHFHRWLGDAYGNASTPMGDSTLFRVLNDSLTAVGVLGVQGITGGKSWTELLEEYAAAIMLNGTAAPQGPTSIQTYDFPSLNRTFSYTGKPAGDYPWPVNVFGENTSSPFGTFTNNGLVGPSGIRILDLTSDGTGLGVAVKVTAPTSGSPFRVVVVRLR